MGTLFGILVIVVFFVWAGRKLREREIRKFRDVDSKMLNDLRQEHPMPEGADQTADPAAVGESFLSKVPLSHQSDEVVSTQDPVSKIVAVEAKTIVFTEVERTQLKQLETLLNDNYRVFTKLAVAEFLTTHHSETVTFAICHRDYYSFELAIEFTNRSSANLEALLAEAHKPLVLIDDSTSTSELKLKLKQVLPGIVKENSTDDNANLCPTCFGKMKLREPTVGKNAGKRYWLCQSYPRCRGVIPA